MSSARVGAFIQRNRSYPLGVFNRHPDEKQQVEVDNRSRSTACVHLGVIRRSTADTATLARQAQKHHEGRIWPSDRLETASLREADFVGHFTRSRDDGPHHGAENASPARLGGSPARRRRQRQ